MSIVCDSLFRPNQPDSVNSTSNVVVEDLPTSNMTVEDLPTSVVVYSQNSPNQLCLINGNYLCDKDSIIEVTEARHIAEFHLPFLPSGSSINSLLSCNGLLMVSYGEFDYFLPQVTVCNPLTGKYFTLPEPRNLPSSLFQDKFRCTYGFGFHPVTKQYKVVMKIESGHKQRFHVFTLGTSDWRSVDNGGYKIAVGTQGVACNGALNWVGFYRTQDRRRDRIVSFNLLSEKFSSISLPYRCRCVKNSQLFVLGGSISFCSDYAKKVAVSIWTMTEYGVEESWTRKFIIRSDLINYSIPLMFLPNGKLFLMNYDKESWDYDPETGTYDEFVWKDLPCYSHMTAIEASLEWPFM